MTTYSISLDDVDLALLPLSTHSNNNFLKKEHYQFQVMKSVPESTPQYTCHICAIEVPVAFAHEHAASVKHQANVRIASVAAERMRAFISALPPPFVKQAGRFCTNCAIEVSEGHENTKEHRNAAMLDNLLRDLTKVYVQDEDEEIFDNNKTCENNDSGKINEYKNDVSFDKAGGDNINNVMVDKCTKNDQSKEVMDEVTDEEDQIENTETTDEIEECSEDEELSTNETDYNESLHSDTSKIAEESTAEKATNVNCVEYYEEALRQFLNENDYFEYNESIQLNIKLNEYSLSNIGSDRFQSYDKRYFSDNIKCIVCDCVLDYEEAEIHKYDSEHLCLIANFGNDGHYIREINELYSHCILCNRKIENTEMETHKQDPWHKLQMSMHTNTSSITNKTKTEEITEEKVNESQHRLESSDKTAGSIEYPYEMTVMGKVRCVVCECHVPSGVRNREEHVKGIRHRTTALNQHSIVFWTVYNLTVMRMSGMRLGMTTYSISLDDVDLALLPLRTHKYNDFLKKEHFQFQVMKTEEVEELEPTIYYKCHICALDVPAAFAHEHTTSLKHRANARIARVATQRTRKLISALPPPLAPQTAQFCANCSTIVQKNHEKTKEHRVAVMHDKLLWELMTAYVGDGCDDEDSDLSDTDESVQGEASSRRYNGFATWNEVNNNKEEKQKKCEPKGLTSIERNKKEIGKKEDYEAEKRNNENKPLENKTKIIEVTNIDTRKPESSKSSEINIETGTNKPIDTEPTQTTAKNEDIATSSPKPQDKIEYVEFVSKNNKIVKVFSDHYHSFTRKGETISCKVCSIVFKSEEVDSHMFSLKHLNKMASSLIDEHCVRKVN
ncbi:uncharacterized protein LOC134659943 [Cydia amplana]|uniref:uncharacterized protein LOC134659943 n=1 Tax=Cydia amplana TaxID=1869771 RepID=UPI002FE672A8